jgi:hypothetical protein
MENIWD